MKKTILITGGAGGVGEFLTRRLAAEGFSVRVFDLATPRNQKVFNGNEQDIALHWGDILDGAALREAMTGVDEVFHLAALVPPVTEQKPELAQKVNVQGTRAVAEAALTESERAGRPVKLCFSSSVATYGITNHLKPPLPPDQPVNPCDTYSESKVRAEEIVRNGGLPFTIFRFAAAVYLKLRKENFPQMRIIPPDTRIEFVHIRDIGDAFVNSVDNQQTLGRTFVLAGGPRCQMLYQEQLKRTFDYLGMPEPDWKKFSDKPFPLDWYDTAEAQSILRFQNRTLDDYLTDLRHGMGASFHAARYLGGPLMRLFRIHL